LFSQDEQKIVNKIEGVQQSKKEFLLTDEATTFPYPTEKRSIPGTNNRKTKSLIFKQRDESCRGRDFSEEPGAHIKPLYTEPLA
jgi:hypothetical protein